MKKIKMLVELIKTSTKAQIITGLVTVGVVAGGAYGGVVVYNNYQEKLAIEEERILEENRKLDNLALIEDYCNNAKITMGKLEENEKVLKVNTALEDLLSKLATKDTNEYDNCISSVKELETLINELVEDEKKVLLAEFDKVRANDISKLTDEQKGTFNEKMTNAEKAINEVDFAKAKEMISDADKYITDTLAEIAKQEQLKKEEEEKQLAENTQYTETSTTNNAVSNSSSGTNNTVSSNSGVSSNTGSSNNSGSSNNGATSNTTPAPAPTQKPSGPYDISKEKEDWYAARGINIQSIGLGQPFYDYKSDTWYVLQLESDTTDYSDVLIGLFNDPDAEYYGSGGVFGYLRSTGEIVRRNAMNKG